MFKKCREADTMTKPAYLLALDQGTTSCRAIVFDESGRIISSTQHPTTQTYPKPGWVEQDAEEILKTQITVMQDTVAKTPEPGRIAAVGLTNQRETVVMWDKKTGKPVYPAIVWQCRRTVPICQTIVNQGLGDVIAEKTGLVVDAYFSATKLMWLLDEVPGVRERAERGDLLAGTIDTWLIWHLSGRQRHVTDASNASRTMLFNLQTGTWDEELLREFRIPGSILPEIIPSSGIAAHVDPNILPGRPPIGGIAGDQQAALFGQACLTPGMTKNTYGTGCFILMNTGRKPVRSRHHLLTTVAWDLGDGLEYALEGSVFHTGSAIQWLRDRLGIISHSAECDLLAAAVEDTGGVHFVPAFSGLGAPYWNTQARGMITGLTRGSGREHIARAVLESIAHQSLDVLECMQLDAGSQIPVLRVDGGASVSDLLMQFQADICGFPVDRPRITETTALGAACLAGLAVGVIPKPAAIDNVRANDKLFQPVMSDSERRQRRQAWRQAVTAAIGYGQSGGCL